MSLFINISVGIYGPLVIALEYVANILGSIHSSGELQVHYIDLQHVLTQWPL